MRAARLIYVIEEPWLAELCKMSIENHDSSLQVSIFSNSSTALEEFHTATQKPELVCASLLRMNGLELAHHIKSAQSATRFLLTSGWPIQEVNCALEAADTPPDAFLPKPFSIDTFIAYVEALLDGPHLPLGDSGSGGWPFCLNRRECRSRF